MWKTTQVREVLREGLAPQRPVVDKEKTESQSRPRAGFVLSVGSGTRHILHSAVQRKGPQEFAGAIVFPRRLAWQSPF